MLLLLLLHCECADEKDVFCRLSDLCQYSICIERTIFGGGGGGGGGGTARASGGGGRGGGDVELAVFRFTLGIPGFDDALIPRVVGVLGSLLILLNHYYTPEPERMGNAQRVTETLGLVLGGVGMAAPTVQQRLDEAGPGKGRKAPLDEVEGGSNVLLFDEGMSDVEKEEVAWASFAVLKNANVCGLCLVVSGKAVFCRGVVGRDVVVPGAPMDTLSNVGKECIGSKLPLDGSEVVYVERKDELVKQGIASAVVPSGACGVATLPLIPTLLDLGGSGGGNTGTITTSTSSATASSTSTNSQKEEERERESMGHLILLCDRDKAMSQKELRWCRAIASKLYHVFYETDS